MSIYDGAPKYETKDCTACPFYLHDLGAARLLCEHTFPAKFRGTVQRRRFCIWGVAVKTIVPTTEPRHCSLRARASPGAEKWMGVVARAEQHGAVDVDLPGLIPANADSSH